MREVKEFIVKLYCPLSSELDTREAEDQLEKTNLAYEMYVGGKLHFSRQGYDPEMKGFSIITWRPVSWNY